MCVLFSVTDAEPSVQKVLGVGAMGGWVGGWLAGCVSALVLRVSQCSHHSPLGPGILRLEGLLIIQDREPALGLHSTSLSTPIS